ncbi:MAG TPA: PQQ-dependent sugar dehydrogenase [Saprospiraceae bacterium]|nr:PQQ-dependent sugar dehydrogenase [Saprospiraceae bacterium]
MYLKNLLLLISLSIITSNLKAQLFTLKDVASGFNKPVDISNSGIPNDKRLFITEKDGKIKIIDETGSVLPTPFIDIDNKVNSVSNERGLLGLCFHPAYATNGYFFVNYTNNNGNTVISRFTRSATNDNLADATTEKILFTVVQPFENHNGGEINFGKDGYLYIGMGDGGSGGDPGNRAQNPKNMLGKILRIDVDTEDAPYLIPADNPYKENVDTLQEIWSMGWRNPWRFSFDRETNDMWIADVGQNKWEEVNIEPAGQGGLNYGWKCYEGLQEYDFSKCDNGTPFVAPIHVYDNKSDVGCSITGGYVYRGSQNPGLFGKYVYADYCTGRFWALYKNSNGDWQNDDLADLQNFHYATFGEDIAGELYVASLSSGRVFKISDGTSSTTTTSLTSPTIDILTNPLSSILQWRMNAQYKGDITWTIYDLQGKIIKTVQTQKSEDTQLFTADVSQLHIGEYLLKNNVDASITKRFIKL